MRRRLVVLLGLGAAACAALSSLPASGANFASKSENTASVTTDATANYLRLYSDATDPDLVLLSYATKRNSSPLVYADVLNSARQQAAAPCRTTYSYLWGDGSGTRGAWPASSRAAAVTHRYRSPGRYHVTARVEMNGKRVRDTRGSWECLFYTAKKRWRAIAYVFDVTCPAGRPCTLATQLRERGLLPAP